jgi:hypothetical protein
MLQRYEAPDSESSASRKKRRTQSPTSSSDSSSGRSSSSTSAESVEEVQTGGLLLSQLVSMSEGADGDQSLYAQQAKNPERVKGVLKESCCKASCKKKIRFSFVMKMVTFFWALPKVSQDCVLWAIQQASDSSMLNESDSEDGQSDSETLTGRKRISWKIEGVFEGCFKSGFESVLFSVFSVIRILLYDSMFKFDVPSGYFEISIYVFSFFLQFSHFLSQLPRRGISVCRQAFMRLLGISPSRLVRTRNTYKGVDGRTFGFLVQDTILSQHNHTAYIICLASRPSTLLSGFGGQRSAEAAASVSAFLERTYWSIGETMPHEPLDNFSI